MPPKSSTLAATKEHENKDSGNTAAQNDVSAKKSTENQESTGTSPGVKSESQSVGVIEKDSTKLKTETHKTVTDEKLIQEDPKDQQSFDLALKFTCKLLKPEGLLKTVNKNVTKLHLPRTLPLHFCLHQLLSKFENLKVSAY